MTKPTTKPQPTTDSLPLPQDAADRQAHRQMVRSMAPGTPIEVHKPGGTVATGYKLHNGNYGPQTSLIRAPGGEVLRCPVLWIRPSQEAA
ncbi:MAG: hypothetical protein KME02_12830 [Aphanothece saxicola GSE-SYN-MK-01-06B]|jgi:hypothetical protein|nr:hypothetical protein [Aphanothece saxicola GSE-SYN-MK-01-06B]